MKQEAHFQVRPAQVAEQLQPSAGMQAFRRFGLEDELLIDDHIECLPSKWLSSIMDHDGDLSIDPMTLGDQVSFQGERAEIFPKTEPELSMDVIERADDRVRQCLLEQPALSLRTHPSMSVRSVPFVSSNCYSLESAVADDVGDYRSGEP